MVELWLGWGFDNNIKTIFCDLIVISLVSHKVRRFQSVIDRHHQANHTACSKAYSMASYPFTNNMNSQLSEQLNNSLRKLATVAAYSKVDTYIKFLEVFITVRNLSVKKII